MKFNFSQRGYINNIHPSVIIRADEAKTTGHSWNGVKFMRKPVKRETIASITRHVADKTYMAAEILWVGSIIVIIATNKPMKINATPSIIHSIRSMFFLSSLISPKFLTMDFVGR